MPDTTTPADRQVAADIAKAREAVENLVNLFFDRVSVAEFAADLEAGRENLADCIHEGLTDEWERLYRLAVARQLLGTTGTTTSEPESGCAHCGSPDHAWDDCVAYTALVRDDAAAPPAPADRAVILRVVDRLAAHARGFQDVLDESDRGPWGKTIGADIAELRRLAGAAAAGVQQTITSDPLADCATEYRVPVPENGGTELRLRKGHAPYTSGWSVAVPGYGGGRALTELGWSDSIGALSADRLFCWPAPAAAVDAARRALPAAPAAPEEPTR